MYATAHRLRHDSGATGYNGFMYLHGDEPVPSSLDPERLAEAPPGQTVAEILTIPKGGNHVDSYLDVVGPDDATVDDLDETLGHVAADLPTDGSHRTVVRDSGDFAVRFFASDRTPGSTTDEFDRLARVILRLGMQHESSEYPTMLIEEHRTDDGWKYALSRESEKHLPDDEERLFAVNLSETTREALEAKHGAIYPMLVDLIFPPDSDAPQRFSRVHVTSARTGETLWRSDD